MDDNDENIKICQVDGWTGTSEGGNNGDVLCRAFETEMTNRHAAEIEKASRNNGKTMQISAIEQNYINRIANGKERINHTAEQ